MSDVMYSIQKKSRDNVRTPMHWDTSPNCGFTGPGVKPWLRMNSTYADINVYIQEKDSDSVLNYYRKLIQVRKQHPLMVSFSSCLPQERQRFADHSSLSSTEPLCNSIPTMSKSLRSSEPRVRSERWLSVISPTTQLFLRSRMRLTSTWRFL